MSKNFLPGLIPTSNFLLGLIPTSQYVKQNIWEPLLEVQPSEKITSD